MQQASESTHEIAARAADSALQLEAVAPRVRASALCAAADALDRQSEALISLAIGSPESSSARRISCDLWPK